MTRRMTCPRSWMLLTAVAAVFFAASLPARAVPVFSRKYQTSCQTCHTVFPKLNAFGEAFRLNGYHLPAETEEQIKQTPVSLGSEAYEKTWPDMVYPGTIPGNVPVAINIKMADLYASSLEDGDHVVVHNDFLFPEEINLFTAGTLGKIFGFLGELTYEELPDGSTETGIERAQFTINSPFGPEHLFNFKVGKFAPDLTDGLNEMWIMTDNGIDTLFSYDPIGFNGGTGLGEDAVGISLPTSVKAIEMYGVGAHRLFYTVGIANGMGPGVNETSDGNATKDVYARLDYKFGGMGLDGDTTGVTLPPENWRENSLRVGLLGYWGNGEDIPVEITDPDGNPFKMEDKHFERYGAYFSWYLRDLNVFGSYLHGKDKLTLLDDVTEAKIDENTVDYNTWFAQADYVFVPPFQGSLRYERLNPADSSVDPLEFLNADFTFLIRANIKVMTEYRLDLQESKNYTLAAVLRFAM